MSRPLFQNIRGEIAQVEKSLAECKHELKRTLGEGEKRWEIEREMRSLHVRLKELNRNLEACAKVPDTH